MNAFELLNKNNICYAVEVSHIRSKIYPEIKPVGSEYRIVMMIKDKLKDDKIKFRESIEDRHLLEKLMNDKLIFDFEDRLDRGEFVRYIKNKWGEVFFLKNNSFREYYRKNVVNNKWDQ